jgi:hypothetical protein
MDFTCPICRKDFKEQLPQKIQDIILTNNKFEKKPGGLNIHSVIEFPPL